MTRALFPGTFDPVTLGHLDVIRRGREVFDELIVAVGPNPDKEPVFGRAERMAMIKEAIRDGGYDGVRVVPFDGLVVDFARKVDAKVILRGLRTFTDFEYEFQMALTNRSLAPGVETVFIMSPLELSFVASRLIKEVARFGGEVRNFVPECVAKRLERKFPKKKSRGR